jgi:hypothetical protein
MNNVSKTVLAALCAVAFSSVALASQPPSTGLGQAWPNTTDVSKTPHYHVYLFQKDGIKYVQVNDLNGNVLGAVATAGKETLILPIGNAATDSTPSASAASSASTSSNASETVYSDKAVQVTTTPQSDGTTKITALLVGVCTNPWDCQNGNVVAPIQ